MKKFILPIGLCLLMLGSCAKEELDFTLDILGTWELAERWEDGNRITRTDSTVLIFKATEIVTKSWDSTYTETTTPYYLDEDNLYLDGECHFVQKLDDADMIYTKCAENVRFDFVKL